MAANTLKLYSYWRSSAAYRIRIALNLKGLPHEIVPVHLASGGGEQHSENFRILNPQEMVPVLVDGNRIVRQSLAILEYLEESWPDPTLLPPGSRDRARVRGIAQLIACDIHPLNNLRVLQFFENIWSVPQPERVVWVRHWIEEGFRALEMILSDNPATGSFCEGDAPTIADVCLVPQVYNAERFGVDMTPYPTVARVNAECLKLPAFDSARPEVQADAPNHNGDKA
ncbi:MAG TPA: maleylacetoacetate isomerase [Xanthomonadaceae bacterium]|nr:maleylacetoacetate isomerase [Xanthomonadaceae bacterium]